jgi:hypothetical protein
MLVCCFHEHHPITGPGPALGISAEVAREVIRNWKSRKHEKHWLPIRRQRQAKGFLKKPSAKEAGELLNLSRNQLKIMTGLLTGHWHLKGHPFKWRLVDIPECDRRKQASEMASHVLCEWPHMFFVTVQLWPHYVSGT